MGIGKVLENEGKWTVTDNGEQCLNTTESKCLDLFALGGAIRGSDRVYKNMIIEEAYNENEVLALRALFYVRDIRKGYGERDTFNSMFARLADLHTEAVVRNLWAVLEFGRAKDLYSLIGTKAEEDMWQFMRKQFEIDLENMKNGESISLLAKWIATPDAKSVKTEKLGIATAKKLGYNFKNMKEYRKKLKSLRAYLDLPEAKICSGRWNEIEYSKCASKFILKNRKNIINKDGDRFVEFIESVNKGEATVNTGTLTPYDVYMQAIKKDSDEIEMLWKNLPDMVNGNALVMCDVSGSMENGYGKERPLDVAVALTMYIAERNKGDLKDLFMTFSSETEIVKIKGERLSTKINMISASNWGMSTDLKRAFEELLKLAVDNKLAYEEMPEAIIVISDMQIDSASNEVDINGRMNFYDKMKRMYASKGYNMPQLVFWNVSSKRNVFHASKDSACASLVSGYSQNVYKQVIDNIGKTPYELMVEVLSDERYSKIV
jgi:hypothetical protein